MSDSREVPRRSESCTSSAQHGFLKSNCIVSHRKTGAALAGVAQEGEGGVKDEDGAHTAAQRRSPALPLPASPPPSRHPLIPQVPKGPVPTHRLLMGSLANAYGTRANRVPVAASAAVAEAAAPFSLVDASSSSVGGSGNAAHRGARERPTWGIRSVERRTSTAQNGPLPPSSATASRLSSSFCHPPQGLGGPAAADPPLAAGKGGAKGPPTGSPHSVRDPLRQRRPSLRLLPLGPLRQHQGQQEAPEDDHHHQQQQQCDSFPDAEQHSGDAGVSDAAGSGDVSLLTVGAGPANTDLPPNSLCAAALDAQRCPDQGWSPSATAAVGSPVGLTIALAKVSRPAAPLTPQALSAEKDRAGALPLARDHTPSPRGEASGAPRQSSQPDRGGGRPAVVPGPSSSKAAAFPSRGRPFVTLTPASKGPMTAVLSVTGTKTPPPALCAEVAPRPVTVGCASPLSTESAASAEAEAKASPTRGSSDDPLSAPFALGVVGARKDASKVLLSETDTSIPLITLFGVDDDDDDDEDVDEDEEDDEDDETSDASEDSLSSCCDGDDTTRTNALSVVSGFSLAGNVRSRKGVSFAADSAANSFLPVCGMATARAVASSRQSNRPQSSSRHNSSHKSSSRGSLPRRSVVSIATRKRLSTSAPRPCGVEHERGGGVVRLLMDSHHAAREGDGALGLMSLASITLRRRRPKKKTNKRRGRPLKRLTTKADHSHQDGSMARDESEGEEGSWLLSYRRKYFQRQAQFAGASGFGADGQPDGKGMSVKALAVFGVYGGEGSCGQGSSLAAGPLTAPPDEQQQQQQPGGASALTSFLPVLSGVAAISISALSRKFAHADWGVGGGGGGGGGGGHATTVSVSLERPESKHSCSLSEDKKMPSSTSPTSPTRKQSVRLHFSPMVSSASFLSPLPLAAAPPSGESRSALATFQEVRDGRTAAAAAAEPGANASSRRALPTWQPTGSRSRSGANGPQPFRACQGPRRNRRCGSTLNESAVARAEGLKDARRPPAPEAPQCPLHSFSLPSNVPDLNTFSLTSAGVGPFLAAAAAASDSLSKLPVVMKNRGNGASQDRIAASVAPATVSVFSATIPSLQDMPPMSSLPDVSAGELQQLGSALRCKPRLARPRKEKGSSFGTAAQSVSSREVADHPCFEHVAHLKSDYSFDCSMVVRPEGEDSMLASRC